MSQVLPYNKSKPVVATTVPHPPAPSATLGENSEKQGGNCCGCCCDYRRAIVICAAILVVLEVLLIIFIATGGYATYNCGDTIECEEFMKKYEKREIAFSILSIVFGIGAIVGARIYNIGLVGTNALWLIVGIILNVAFSVKFCNEWEAQGAEYYCETPVGVSVIAIIVILLFVYPHVAFIMEVKKGIMSTETYQREEYSCCCV